MQESSNLSLLTRSSSFLRPSLNYDNVVVVVVVVVVLVIVIVVLVAITRIICSADPGCFVDEQKGLSIK